MVERAKAGDKAIFTGTFIVVPDVAQLGLPGVNAEMMRQAGGGRGGGATGGLGSSGMGISGLKALGVKDLTYKTAFLACMVQGADTKVGHRLLHPRKRRHLLILICYNGRDRPARPISEAMKERAWQSPIAKTFYPP